MFIGILKYGFLVIFFATSVIGIAGIPGWIKIPEYYRKRIFIALILEVVGVIIILFRQEVMTNDTDFTPKIEINDNNWVALNASGLLVKPKVTFKNGDTSFVKSIGHHRYLIFSNLNGQISKTGLRIINSDSHSLGTIESWKLQESGLFNAFATASDEISSAKNYAYVRWNKRMGENWKKKGRFIGPFELEVMDTDEGTHYRIRNTVTDSIVDDSRNYGRDLIGMDNRKIHFLRHQNVYFFLRIATANLTHTDKFIHVIYARLEPTFTEPS